MEIEGGGILAILEWHAKYFWVGLMQIRNG